MNDLYDYLLKLENNLDHEEVIQKLRSAYMKVKNNKELVSRVFEYNNTKSEVLRNELRQDLDIRRVKELEAKLNYIILEINQNLSILTNKRGLL